MPNTLTAPTSRSEPGSASAQATLRPLARPSLHSDNHWRAVSAVNGWVMALIQLVVRSSVHASTIRSTSSSRSPRSTTRSPRSRGTVSHSPRGACSSSTWSTPTHASSRSPRCGSQRSKVPSKENPSFQATRRDAQLPAFAHQMTVRSRCSWKPHSSSSRNAASTMPRPRAHGCAPNAISARRLPSSRSSTVPQKRGSPPGSASSSTASTANAQWLSPHPAGTVSRTNRSAWSRV